MPLRRRWTRQEAAMMRELGFELAASVEEDDPGFWQRQREDERRRSSEDLHEYLIGNVLRMFEDERNPVYRIEVVQRIGERPRIDWRVR